MTKKYGYVKLVMDKIDKWIGQGEQEYYKYPVYHYLYKLKNDKWIKLGQINISDQLTCYMNVSKIVRVEPFANSCDIECDKVHYKIECKPNFFNPYRKF